MTTKPTLTSDLDDAIQDVLEFLDDQADVVDGSYGEQHPNRAMTLASRLREAIGEKMW
jgi:hypothetical protein